MEWKLFTNYYILNHASLTLLLPYTPSVQLECWGSCQVGLKRADKGFEPRTLLSASHYAYKANLTLPFLLFCHGAFF